MKTTKTIKVPQKTVKETTREEVTVTCDVCLLKLKKGERYTQCRLCRRDIHIHQYRSEVKVQCYEADNEDWSDYPDYYCRYCAEIWFPVRTEMNERHYSEEEKLMEKAKKESLAITNSN